MKKTMRVCLHCLLAIESREGSQATQRIPIDPDDYVSKCEWCGETADEGGFDELHEIIF